MVEDKLYIYFLLYIFFKNINIIFQYQLHEKQYLNLAKIAKDYLAIPGKYIIKQLFKYISIYISEFKTYPICKIIEINKFK